MPTRIPRDGEAATAAIFKALGHPQRLRAVAALAQGPRTVGELHAPVDCDLSTLSKHLAVLKRAGVITATRRGREQVYALKLVCAADFLTCLTRVHATKPAACDCARAKAARHG